MGFREIASPLAVMGVPTTPVLPNSKKAFMADWPTSATTDLAQIEAWDKQYPGYNGGAVARGSLGGVWFFEVDSREVQERIQAETGLTIPTTFRVRSRPGRGHFYWKQTPASISMGNISQAYVKGGDWSARVDNAYVVAPGSIHPHSLQPYLVMEPADTPIIEAPDWLINWLISQKVDKKGDALAVLPKDPHGLVPHGFIHGYMLTQAGKLRNIGMEVDLIEASLLQLVHENCAPPIDDAKIKAMAKSVCNSFAPGRNTDLLLTQPQARPEEPEPPPEFDIEPYPKFPHFVMERTSLYRNFVEPVCAKNSRIDYFMWVPAMVMLLNYIGTKVSIKTFGEKFRGSIYTILIGKKGKAHKSESVNDALKYFNNAGILQHANRDTKTADGRTLVWTAGSPEGLGINMQKTNCKNAMLYYDELSQLVNKAGIESSSLSSSLLTMYESGKFDNSIKSVKETFCHEPDTYCTSLIACTTDGKFAEQWSKLAGADTGLDDRFFFALQPEKLPVPRLKTYVNTMLGSVETKLLVDKAIQQKEYGFLDVSPLQQLVEIDPRYANRAEKWALALAVDLNLTEIDEECVERAIEIVKYEIKVKKYLKSYEATTREGQLQQEIRRQLEMFRGRMNKRELLRKLHYDKHGTSLWGQSYGGLIKTGVIREEGGGTRSDPTVVQLLQKREVEED
jgi:hypothetical protein